MSNLKDIHSNLVRAFRTGKTRSYEFRLSQLKSLKKFVVDNEAALAEALAADLHRCAFEAIGLEISSLVTELDHVIENLKTWMQPKYTKIPAAFAPATSSIVHEPYGLCLVIGAFNYPFVLSLSPLVGAIAAGNAAILKPSEMSSATEKLLATLLPKYLDANFYQVVCGDAAVSSELLSLRFDKIFFTGSTRVGKIVAKAAAEHLTPVSLELGGKSPTIVDKDVVNLEVVAKRIVWGKLVNAGQTCIAPDYVYCHETIYPRLLEAMKQKIGEFYGADPQQSPDLSRIISRAHTERLDSLLQDSKDCVYYGGQVNKADRYVQPTLLTNVKKDAKVMQEEIFGPLLPIFTYKEVDEVVQYVNSGEKPLTMYIFTRNSALSQSLCAKIPSGSVVVNDTLFQFANMFAPFGGVGHSGMGGYHGEHSFDCFSQKRSILVRDGSALLDIPIRYPPYTAFGLNFFRFALKLPHIPVLALPSMKDLLLVGLAAFALYEIFTHYVPS